MLILFRFCILVVTFLSTLTIASSDEWVRITKPSQELRNQLHSKAIQYEHFIWVKKDDVTNETLEGNDNIEIIQSPFSMMSGDLRFDLLDTLSNRSQEFQDLSSDSHSFHLIQFNGPIKTEWLEEVSDLGIKLIKPMAPFSYIVWSNKSSINNIKNLESVRWSGYFYSTFKLQSHYRTLDSSNISTMSLVYKSTKDTVLAEIQSLGGNQIIERNIDKNFVALTFKVAGNHYSHIAEIPGVLTIQKINQDGGARGEMSQQSIVGNYDENDVVFSGYNNWLNASDLDGSGVIVGVVDGGIYENHPDLTDNMVACVGLGPSCQDDVDSHGTHVAGAIAGTGNSGVTDQNGFLRGLGVAPNAKIVQQLYSPLLGGGPGGMVAGGMLSIYKDSEISGALLTNNSWGPTGSPQGYDIPTMEIDMISRDANPDKPGNQPVLAVWSIMNGNGDRNGACSPSSLGSPDEAKNLFAVGSTKLQNGSLSQISDIFDVSSNSAHGPACDGRLVPHVVAPGCSTDAPDSANGYGTKCGTSMASPVVSGSVSLFWQQYKETYQLNPSSALIKAVFTVIAKNLNGYRDADGVIMGQAPDRKQGWGRIDLDAVINPENKIWYYDQETIFTQSGEMWTQTLYPDDANKPIRLMLVWTDTAGAGLGGSSPALVNDLDLSVMANVELFKGNVFGTDAFSESGGDADRINNMEGIFLKPSQHNGNGFEVSVMAANITGDALNPYDSQSPAQDFALVCYNCSDGLGFDVIFKNSFDNFIDLIFSNGFE